MSSRRARVPAPEAEAPSSEVVAYMTPADPEPEPTENIHSMNDLPKDGSVHAGDEEKNYINLPKLTDTMPDFETKSAENLREWLRDHGVKGTWSKKLLPKCKDVWDDMMVIVRDRAIQAGAPLEEHSPAAADEEEPDFDNWDLERKRAYLRRRDVKGIWEKYTANKCQEIWRLEKMGEKYVHSPSSLGRSAKGRYQTMLNVGGPLHIHPSAIPIHMAHLHMPNHPVITNDAAPLSITPADFSELAGAAHQNDLKRVTDLLNNWSSKNMLPEEPPNMTIEEATAHASHSGEGMELRWVHSEISPTGVVRSKKRSSASPSTPAKRKRVANGQALSADADGEVVENGPSLDEFNGLQARLREMENALEELRAENASLKGRK